MDQFGIAAGVTGAMNCYFMSARRTGRTTQLVESVKNGDRIIFDDRKEAARVKRLIKERGIEVECITIPPSDPDAMLLLGTTPKDGRTIFDHSWLESYYVQVMRDASTQIARLEQRLSGYGAAHRETRRSAEEIAKWQF